MSRINKILKALDAKKVASYRIIETQTTSYQQFYDLQKLETVRCVDTLEEKVTIYLTSEVEGKKTVGEASFVVSHDEAKANLEKMIDQALYEASFIKNDYYELPKGDKKLSRSYKPLEEKPFVILTKMAKIFFEKANDVARFNALELFFNDETTRIVNSNGVDYKKKTFQIEIEAIPSFYSDTLKTELYRMFRYNEVNYDKVQKDATSAISDVYNRGKAIKLENVPKCNIILHDQEIGELCYELIDNLNYASVYSKSNLKNIGEKLTTNKINISVDSKNKYDYFDDDGVRLAKCDVIKDGMVNSYFGSNRFGYYLNMVPTGNLDIISLAKGKKSVESFKKKPYLEIFDMSGIQVDAYQNYLGGEVRLALYFDGEDIIPVSGFSFSADLMESIENMEVSKETNEISYYRGAKYVLIKGATIN